MTRRFFAIVLAAFALSLNSTYGQLTAPASGGSKKASISERIGITDVTIHYDRPGVKSREGKIWGNLVHEGFADLDYGSARRAPWRAGANESTTITFSTDVTVEGQPLPAGTYGFFIAYHPSNSTLIFSRNHHAWGSYFYDSTQDVLRVNVVPTDNPQSVEWLKYEFSGESEDGATISLFWEKKVISFRVKVDLVATQLASFRKELETDKGFQYESWAQAAQWCADHNTNLDQALLWADTATGLNMGGDRSFQAWSAKAAVLRKLGKESEAIATIKKAVPFGNRFEVHQYAYQLMKEKKYPEAMEIYKANYEANPGEFITTLGMARGYSGLGDAKKATEFAQKAQKIASTPTQVSMAEKAITLLKEGKSIAQ